MVLIICHYCKCKLKHWWDMTTLLLQWPMCQSVFHCCDKALEKINSKEERFTLAPGFRGFINGCLAPLLWSYGESELHVKEHMAEQSCSSHDSQVKDRGRARGQNRPSKISLQWPTSPSQALPPKVSTTYQ